MLSVFASREYRLTLSSICDVPEGHVDKLFGALLPQEDAHEALRGRDVLREEGGVLEEVFGGGDPSLCVERPLKGILPK